MGGSYVGGSYVGGSCVGGRTVQFGWPLDRWGSVSGGGLIISKYYRIFI